MKKNNFKHTSAALLEIELCEVDATLINSSLPSESLHVSPVVSIRCPLRAREAAIQVVLKHFPELEISNEITERRVDGYTMIVFEVDKSVKPINLIDVRSTTH